MNQNSYFWLEFDGFEDCKGKKSDFISFAGIRVFFFEIVFAVWAQGYLFDPLFYAMLMEDVLAG